MCSCTYAATYTCLRAVTSITVLILRKQKKKEKKNHMPDQAIVDGTLIEVKVTKIGRVYARGSTHIL